MEGGRPILLGRQFHAAADVREAIEEVLCSAAVQPEEDRQVGKADLGIRRLPEPMEQLPVQAHAAKGRWRNGWQPRTGCNDQRTRIDAAGPRLDPGSRAVGPVAEVSAA